MLHMQSPQNSKMARFTPVAQLAAVQLPSVVLYIATRSDRDAACIDSIVTTMKQHLCHQATLPEESGRGTKAAVLGLQAQLEFNAYSRHHDRTLVNLIYSQVHNIAKKLEDMHSLPTTRCSPTRDPADGSARSLYLDQSRDLTCVSHSYLGAAKVPKAWLLLNQLDGWVPPSAGSK